MTAGPVTIDSTTVAVVLMRKALLLKKVGRLDESLAVCDEVFDRFSAHKEDPVRIIMGATAFLSGAILWGLGRRAAAADAFEQASEFMTATALRELEPVTSLVHGLALLSEGRAQEALAVLDDVIARYNIVAEPQLAGIIASAVLLKATILEEMDLVLEEKDVLLLIESVANQEDLRPGAIHFITRYAAIVSPARTLELIRESRTEDLLLPLVVALQQELGDTPLVAKEVEDVAADIRRELSRMRAEPE